MDGVHVRLRRTGEEGVVDLEVFPRPPPSLFPVARNVVLSKIYTDRTATMWTRLEDDIFRTQ